MNEKNSKVNLAKAYEKFGKKTEDDGIKMRLNYKHERDYDRNYYNTEGETVGTRDEMKIMRDYLVGYARKDCIGKYAWVGDRTWRKVRGRDGERFRNEDHEWIGGTEWSEWVQLGLLEQIK
jgi:hypothetical protein